jgi:hypothetical protein
MISVPLPANATPGGAVRASEWNRLVEAVRALTPQVEVLPPAGVFPHPWRVTVAREGEPGAEKLRVRVAAGCVNDQAATIVWKAKDDPRGPLPETSRAAWEAAKAEDPKNDFLKDYWDRPLHEAEPPTLLVDLDPGGKDWTERKPERVPKDLRESASTGAKFHAAGVVLAAFPFNIVLTRVLPKRFRVYAGKANPAAIRQARVGELLELARIYQVRGSGGELEAVAVRQLVFWNLAAAAYEPDLQKVDPTLPTLPSFGGIGLGFADSFLMGFNLTNQALAASANAAITNIEQQLDPTEFWTHG